MGTCAAITIAPLAQSGVLLNVLNSKEVELASDLWDAMSECAGCTREQIALKFGQNLVEDAALGGAFSGLGVAQDFARKYIAKFDQSSTFGRAVAQISEIKKKASGIWGDFSDKLKEKFGKIVKNVVGSRYSRSAISNISGFSDEIATLATQNGLTLDQFKLLQQKTYETMSPQEKAIIDAIRNSIPRPDGNTILQKVIHKSMIEKYISGPTPYTQVGGFVSTAKDSKHLSTYDDIFNGMRLDYPNSNFKPTDRGCGIIRYKTASPNLTIPKHPGVYPYTGNGFTSGVNGKLGVPEWESPYSTPTEGSELWELLSDGTELLIAKFSQSQNKFIPIK